MLVSLRKVSPVELILIPHRITTKCIIAAKSNKAKEILCSLIADASHLSHNKEYLQKHEDKKSALEIFKNFFT